MAKDRKGRVYCPYSRPFEHAANCDCWDCQEKRFAAAERRYYRRLQLRAIVALWGRPLKTKARDTRKGWTIYDGYTRNRDEEWTVWRAVLCTIAILLRRYWSDDAQHAWAKRHGKNSCWADTPTLAYFDCWPVYGGYNAEIVQLAPGCRFSVFNDGETNL